jgi:hypothetical protein
MYRLPAFAYWRSDFNGIACAKMGLLIVHGPIFVYIR